MFKCAFCDKDYTQNAGGMVHQKQCKLNPNRTVFQKGRKAWNTGKTAQSDHRLAALGVSVGNSLRGRKPGNWNPNRASLDKYRTDCCFKFSVYDFPNEFELGLIEECGWYSASNRGNNLDGVSRDHMVSVKFGFENNVAAGVISHPANCRLLKHRDNVRKYTRNSIAIEELHQRILRWDEKYLGD